MTNNVLSGTLNTTIPYRLVVSEISGGPRFTLGGGAYAPLTLLSGEFFCTLGEYFTISNCVFNFSFLLHEILGWSQIYIRGRSASWMPLPEKFLYPRRVLWHNCVFNFNFLALVTVVCEILGSPKFTLGGPAPRRPPSGQILTYAQVLANIYIIVNFQLRSFIHHHHHHHHKRTD